VTVSPDNEDARLRAQAEKIRAIMEATGLTLDEIADRVVLKRETMRKYAGGYQPASPRIMAMIEALPQQAAGDSLRLAEPVATYGSDPRSLLKRRREELKLSVDDLAKKSKVPAGYIRQIEAGEVQGSNEKQLRKLATALDLDVAALMSGSDHPPTVGPHRQTFGASPPVKTTDKITPKTIPLISMAQAGELVEFDDVYDYEGVIAYDGKDPRAFAVRIRGDSMAPNYGEGTIAICYPSHPPKNDNLVIAKLRDGSVLFKRVQITAGEVIFHSMNPNYQPLRYPERDLVWIYPVGLTQKTEL
jgi:SOS-response transcriptional repressor LexA